MLPESAVSPLVIKIIQVLIVRDAIADRNLAAHTNNEKIAIAVEARIRNEYFPLLQTLYETFKAKLEGTD